MRRAAVVPAAVVMMIGLASAGFTQDCRIPVFAGDLGAVELGGWGSGTIELDEDETYLDNNALKVETTGFFAGGRLGLKQPLEAARFLSDPAGGYLKLVVKIHEPEPEQPLGEGGMFPGEGGMFPGEGGMFPGEGGMFPGEVPPGFDPGMMEPGMDPGWDPGMIDPGMMGPEWDPGMMEPGMGGPMAAPEPPKKISQLRALIVTDEGAIDSGEIEVADYAEIVEDWVQIVLPLDRFAGPLDVTNGRIQHIAVFGDVEEIFWLGDLTLGYEAQPLLADAGENRTVKVDQKVQFEAAPQPEGVRANYVWDFDHLDGLQEEGYGRETTWTFRTPGYYVVTLTVTDSAGDRIDRTDMVHLRVTK